jgi:hypothetical protein
MYTAINPFAIKANQSYRCCTSYSKVLLTEQTESSDRLPQDTIIIIIVIIIIIITIIIFHH